MNDHNTLDFEFSCKGHHVEVTHKDIPDQLLNDIYTVFTVIVDGSRVVVPNVLDAYSKSGKRGVELVVSAYLDGVQ